MQTAGQRHHEDIYLPCGIGEFPGGGLCSLVALDPIAEDAASMCKHWQLLLNSFKPANFHRKNLYLKPKLYPILNLQTMAILSLSDRLKIEWLA